MVRKVGDGMIEDEERLEIQLFELISEKTKLPNHGVGQIKDNDEPYICPLTLHDLYWEKRKL